MPPPLDAPDAHPTPVARPHEAIVSIILLPSDDIAAFIRRIEAVEQALAHLPHECLAVYEPGTTILATIESLAARPPSLRLVRADGRTPAALLQSAFRAAAGDVVITLNDEPHAPPDDVTLIPQLAAEVRDGHCVVAVPRVPRRHRLVEWLLWYLAAVDALDASTNFRAYAATFLDAQTVDAHDAESVGLELTVKAHLQGAPVGEVHAPPRDAHSALPDLQARWPWVIAALRTPLAVWSVWLLMLGFALLLLRGTAAQPGQYLNIALLAAGAFAFTLAVRRVRLRTRLADAFFSLVLLNPLLFYGRAATHASLAGGINRTLLATGILGLMTGAIIAMKRDRVFRYLAVLLLALSLGAISDSFLILLPALVAWMLAAGYLVARRADTPGRLRGFAIMACGEAGMVAFGLACLLAEPTTAPPPATLFGAVVSFLDFPLLVLAIVTLALGWKHAAAGNATRTPPYFIGLMALLLGLLTLLLNDFHAGALPPPGTDQTVLLLCLLYTVCTLHAPRPVQRFIPPILLAAAIGYTLWH